MTAYRYPKEFVYNQLAPLDAAYCAGLVDGEGCVTIDRITKKKPNGKGFYITYRQNVTISSTTPCLIDFVYDRFPYGSRYVTVVKQKNCMPQDRILLTYRPAVEFARQIREYLVLKGGQADILMSMPLSTNGRWGYTPEIRKEQEKCWKRCRKLNGNGKRGGRPRNKH